MDIFHKIVADHTLSDTLTAVSLIGAGLGILLITLYCLLDWKNKPSNWALIASFTIMGLAVVTTATATVLTSFERVTAKENTSSSLQSWVKDNYGIKLSEDNAHALVGVKERSKAVAVDYKGKTIVVQLVEYKDGYILVNNKNQAVLPQD